MCGVLELAALAVWWQHHAPGDLRGVRRSVVGHHQVQTEVDPGARAGAGCHIAVVDVQHVRVHAHRREGSGELGGAAPVRGGAASVEEPGAGQDEGARADGGEPCPTAVRGP